MTSLFARIITRNRLSDGSDLCAGKLLGPKKTFGGETLIVQLIQLCFLHSLGSATSNKANMSTMLRAEWIIFACRAMLHLAKMKYQNFIPESCKQNAIFSGTSHQDRSYLDNFIDKPCGFQQGRCSC